MWAGACLAARSRSRSWPGQLCTGPCDVRTLLVDLTQCPGTGTRVPKPSSALARGTIPFFCCCCSGHCRIRAALLPEQQVAQDKRCTYVLLCTPRVWLTVTVFPSTQKLSRLHRNFYLGPPPPETRLTLRAWSKACQGGYGAEVTCQTQLNLKKYSIIKITLFCARGEGKKLFTLILPSPQPPLLCASLPAPAESLCSISVSPPSSRWGQRCGPGWPEAWAWVASGSGCHVVPVLCAARSNKCLLSGLPRRRCLFPSAT